MRVLSNVSPNCRICLNISPEVVGGESCPVPVAAVIEWVCDDATLKVFEDSSFHADVQSALSKIKTRLDGMLQKMWPNDVVASPVTRGGIRGALEPCDLAVLIMRQLRYFSNSSHHTIKAMQKAVHQRRDVLVQRLRETTGCDAFSPGKSQSLLEWMKASRRFHDRLPPMPEC